MPLLELQLLGDISLKARDGETPPAELLQPRKLALLSYLAVEARVVSRTEMAGVLWGDVPEVRARASLSQLIHTIRRACPVDPFSAEGQGLRLRTDVVACDVAILYERTTEEHTAELLKAIPTSFMPGFVLAGETAFEEWSVKQRLRFELHVADLAWRGAQESGRSWTAVDYLRIASELRPFDEAILRERMRILAELGDRGAAISLYENFRCRLKQEFDTSPSVATQSLAGELLVVTSADFELSPVTPSGRSQSDVRLSAKRNRFSRGDLSRAVGIGIISIGLLTGILLSGPTDAIPSTAPIVSLSDLRISGGDQDRRTEFANRLPALLAGDTAFDVDTRGTSGARLLLTGTIDLTKNGLDGTLLLRSHTGRVAATLPLRYSEQSDAAAVLDIAHRIRRSIATELASDVESRGVAAIEERLAMAVKHGQNGAYELAEQALAEVEADLDQTDVGAGSRSRIRSTIWERRAWNALRLGRRPDAVVYFERAIDAVRVGSSSDEEAAGRRLADLHYFAWSSGSADSAHLEAALSLVSRISTRSRDAATWLRSGAILYALGRYQEAYSAAGAARAHSLSTALTPELGLLLFQSAFNARRDAAAAAECERIRDYMPRSWPAIACAAMIAGWTNAGTYDVAALLSEVRGLDAPEPLRAAMQQDLQLLLAAASARESGQSLTEANTRVVLTSSADIDHQVFQLALVTARGEADAAKSLKAELLKTVNGARALRSYHRLLN